MATKIETFEQLREALKAAAQQHNVPYEGTDDEVLWFVAMRQAEEILELSRKDMAGMLLEGFPAITKENVPDWLATMYEDIDEEDWPDWRAIFARWFHRRAS